jgi:hypothetical protein
MSAGFPGSGRAQAAEGAGLVGDAQAPAEAMLPQHGTGALEEIQAPEVAPAFKGSAEQGRQGIGAPFPARDWHQQGALAPSPQLLWVDGDGQGTPRSPRQGCYRFDAGPTAQVEQQVPQTAAIPACPPPGKGINAHQALLRKLQALTTGPAGLARCRFRPFHVLATKGTGRDQEPTQGEHR